MMNSDGGEAAVANAELISELVRAHYAGDQRRFGNLLNQFIASESRAGHLHLAQRLRDVRTEAEAAPAPAAKPAQLARAPRDLEHILSVGYSDVRLSDLVLSEENRKALQRLISEQRAAETLAEHGLRPRRRLLLHGPPGCGKTMAAQAIAGELRLPIIRVRLEAIFSRYLGETAATLADIFAEADRVRGVYLFDEFDALGRTRLDDNDVGEVKRIVTTFLQLLDATDDTYSVLVAATNVGASLDRALFRRFDDVLELPGPTLAQAAELLNRLMRQWNEQPDGQTLQAAAGLSFADIHAAVDDVRKEAILEGRTTPRPDEMRDMLLARSARLS
jgi:SpoVK/Ycf46/Vps4 family AAA+-type ATPase